MNLSIKPVAVAVTLALASAAAHAQLTTPGYGTSPPTNGDNTSLILFLWSPSSSGGSGYGEQVNLVYTYSQLTAAGGALTPNSSTSPYVTAANPTGAAGNVLQLNFGTVPNFSTMTGGTGGSGALDYFVAAGNGSTATAFEITDATTPTTTNLPPAGVSVVATDLNSMSWNGTAGNTGVDTSGSANWNPCTTASTVNCGVMDSLNFSGAINTALEFYNATISGRGSTESSSVTQYSNSTGAGFWFLSSTGDLTWNVPLAGPTVPLPAAFWLLASGLAGLGAIGRRRRQGLAAAAV